MIHQTLLTYGAYLAGQALSLGSLAHAFQGSPTKLSPIFPASQQQQQQQHQQQQQQHHHVSFRGAGRSAAPPSPPLFASQAEHSSIGVDGILDAVDRAPCFDGECSTFSADDDANSESLTTNGSSVSNAGEAIQRLGLATGPTVWSEFGRLSQEHDVANLGQGFPDWLPPPFAVESLVSAAVDSAKSPHQYTRTAGHPNLVRELATRYSRHLGRGVDAMNEVAVTVGASQALYLSLQTLVKPGDEVILFEPFFDLYVNQIKLAGGTPVYVPLTFVPHNQHVKGKDEEVTGGTWVLEPEKLQQKISPRTRAIILNSPHNPTGKVFSFSEMQTIANSVMSAGPQCVVLSDEVYKFIVHSPPREEGEDTDGLASTCPGHVHFASLPGMWDRTITVSSAGKTFSATGWQVGWCVGPTHLISPIHQILPYVQFCASTVIQEALARTLPRADEPYEGHQSYYQYLNAKYRRKRDLLGRALTAAGFAIPDYDVTPGGGFFIFARITPELLAALPAERREDPRYVMNPAAPGGVARPDWTLCQWMAEERGVLCIPSSPFFSRERATAGASDEFIRVAFCKTDETIERAAVALMGLRGATAERQDEKEYTGDVDVNSSRV